jgi:hypothetical protein
MRLGGAATAVLVFNSLKTASELLDRRANIFSDRPRLIVAQEILGGSRLMAFMRYGDKYVGIHFTSRTSRTNSFTPSSFGVAIAGPRMKCSQRPWFASITQRSAKRRLLNSQKSESLGETYRALRRLCHHDNRILYDYPTLEDEHDKNLADWEVHGFVDSMSAASATGAYLVELIDALDALYSGKVHTRSCYLLYT